MLNSRNGFTPVNDEGGIIDLLCNDAKIAR